MWCPIEDDEDDCYIVSSSDPPTPVEQGNNFQGPSDRPLPISTQVFPEVMAHLQKYGGVSLTPVTPSSSSSSNPECSNVSGDGLQRQNSDNPVSVIVSPDIPNFEQNSIVENMNNPSCSSLNNVEMTIFQVSQGMFSNGEYQNLLGKHSSRKATNNRKPSKTIKTVKKPKKKSPKKESSNNKILACVVTLLQEMAKQQTKKKPTARKAATNKNNLKYSTSQEKAKTTKIQKIKQLNRKKAPGNRLSIPSTVTSSTDLSQIVNHNVPSTNIIVAPSTSQHPTFQRPKKKNTNPVHMIGQKSNEASLILGANQTQPKSVMPGPRQSIPSTTASTSSSIDLSQTSNSLSNRNVTATVVNPPIPQHSTSQYPITQHSVLQKQKISQAKLVHKFTNKSSKSAKNQKTKHIQQDSGKKLPERRQSIPSTVVSSSTLDPPLISHQLSSRNNTATIVKPTTSQQPILRQDIPSPTMTQNSYTFANLPEYQRIYCELVSSSTPEPPSVIENNANLQTANNNPFKENVSGHVSSNNTAIFGTTKVNISPQVQNFASSLLQSTTTDTSNYSPKDFEDTFSSVFHKIFDNRMEERIIKMVDIMVLVKRENSHLQCRLKSMKSLSQQRLQFQEKLSAFQCYHQAIRRYQTQFGKILGQVNLKVMNSKMDRDQKKSQFTAWFVKTHLLATQIIEDYPKKFEDGRKSLKGLLSKKSLELPLVHDFLHWKDEQFNTVCSEVVTLMYHKECV